VKGGCNDTIGKLRIVMQTEMDIRQAVVKNRAFSRTIVLGIGIGASTVGGGGRREAWPMEASSFKQSYATHGRSIVIMQRGCFASDMHIPYPQHSPPLQG
jgi:hypothetical protein